MDGPQALADEQGCTPAQLALAWLLAQGVDVVPVAGTTQTAHLLDNLGAARLMLPAATVQRLQALFQPHAAQSARYNAQSAAEVDTEEFAALE